MRIQQLNKLTRVQKELKKFGEVELHQTGEGSYMVAVQDAEKRITVSTYKGKTVVTADVRSEKGSVRYKKVNTQKDAIYYINHIEEMDVEGAEVPVKAEGTKKKFEKTNKKLVHIEKGVEFDIVKFNGREGVKTVEFFGVTSGYPIVMLEQINMEGFEIVEKHIEKSTVAPLESPIKITPEVTAMNVTRESESARQLARLIKLEGNKAYEVLDYGCGLGRNIKYLLENTNCFVDGCDTEEQVKNISKDAEKMAYFKNQASTITTSDKLEGGYEFMLNSHVLNVVMDDVKKIIIDDMYRLLAKNGKLVIQVRTESDVASAKSKEKYGDGWLIKKGKDTTYQEGITKEKMHRMLTGAGFKIISHRFTKSIHMVEVTK